LRLLLDTHALLWWLAGDERLPPGIRAHLDDPQGVALVSVVSVFEIATKHRIGKLPLAEDLAADLPRALLAQGFELLPLESEVAFRAGLLPGPNRDPFDRLLIAQALVAGLVLVSNEKVFDAYGVTRLW